MRLIYIIFLFVITSNAYGAFTLECKNLIDQLTAPVKWTQSVQQMIALGVKEYVECGPGKTLQGLIKKIDRSTEVSGVIFE